MVVTITLWHGVICLPTLMRKMTATCSHTSRQSTPRVSSDVQLSGSTSRLVCEVALLRWRLPTCSRCASPSCSIWYPFCAFAFSDACDDASIDGAMLRATSLCPTLEREAPLVRLDNKR
jgi:hypothetical protein